MGESGFPHPENKRYLLGSGLSGGTDHLSQFGGDDGLNLGTQIELSGGFLEGGDVGILADDDAGVLDLLELSGLVGGDGGALLLAGVSGGLVNGGLDLGGEAVVVVEVDQDALGAVGAGTPSCSSSSLMCSIVLAMLRPA